MVGLCQWIECTRTRLFLSNNLALVHGSFWFSKFFLEFRIVLSEAFWIRFTSTTTTLQQNRKITSPIVSFLSGCSVRWYSSVYCLFWLEYDARHFQPFPELNKHNSFHCIIIYFTNNPFLVKSPNTQSIQSVLLVTLLYIMASLTFFSEVTFSSVGELTSMLGNSYVRSRPFYS